MIKASVIAAGVVAACLWLGLPATVSAQSSEEPSVQTTSPAVYEFTAQNGNSMSVLTRKAIQLYDQKTEDLSLPEPCIIAAETKIVQSLGPRWLALGEQFIVDESMVAEYARQASQLTEEQRSAWKVYSDNADFELADVKLTSELVAAQSNTNNDQAESPAESDATSQSETTEGQPETTAETTDGSAPWYWWIVGIGTIGALYYLLGGKPKNQAEKQ
jgi:hypothetical protein